MANSIQSIPLDKLVEHPDNPNRMSSSTLAKLIRNIKRTGRYEPLVVRPHPKRKRRFEIINGHHRCRALRQLGFKRADVVVWDVDDEQADIYLATLNRLGGSDQLAGKIALLKRLTEKMNTRQLARLLPQTPGQIKRLVNLRLPNAPAKPPPKPSANPIVFFMTDKQKATITEALSLAEHPCHAERSEASGAKRRGPRLSKAAGNAIALTRIAQHFVEATLQGCEEDDED